MVGSQGEPLEFWALLSSTGTFLVASAGVRDVLGWSVGEIIGRSLWGMVTDTVHTGTALRTQVEKELMRLPNGEVSVITFSLTLDANVISLISDRGNRRSTAHHPYVDTCPSGYPYRTRPHSLLSHTARAYPHIRRTCKSARKSTLSSGLPSVCTPTQYLYKNGSVRDELVIGQNQFTY